jgi:hypothetical protein
MFQVASANLESLMSSSAGISGPNLFSHCSSGAPEIWRSTNEHCVGGRQVLGNQPCARLCGCWATGFPRRHERGGEQIVQTRRLEGTLPSTIRMNRGTAILAWERGHPGTRGVRGRRIPIYRSSIRGIPMHQLAYQEEPGED